MKILFFVDSHGSRAAFKMLKEQAKEVDLIVCAGDYTIFEDQIEELTQEIAQLGKPTLMIHGNHEEEGNVRQLCKKHKNLEFIHARAVVKGDCLFLGWGGGGFSLKDKEFEHAAKSFKEAIRNNPGKKVVLVTHAPPHGTKIDKVGRSHCGNESISKFIKESKPLMAVAGHLHENFGRRDQIGSTIILNPGPFGAIVTL